MGGGAGRAGEGAEREGPHGPGEAVQWDQG